MSYSGTLLKASFSRWVRWSSAPSRMADAWHKMWCILCKDYPDTWQVPDRQQMDNQMNNRVSQIFDKFSIVWEENQTNSTSYVPQSCPLVHGGCNVENLYKNNRVFWYLSLRSKKHVLKFQILAKSSLQFAMSCCLCHRQKTCNMKALFQRDSSLKNINSRHLFWTISSPFFTPLHKPLRCYYNILENKILAPAGIPFSKIPQIIFFLVILARYHEKKMETKNHQFSCCG